MKDKKITAIVNKACPICGKVDEEQSELLISKRFKDLSDIHNQTIGFGHFCASCKADTEKAVMFVVYDEQKSEDMKNPYRCGEVFGMSDDWIKRSIHPQELQDDMLNKRMAFITYQDAKEIGLPTKYEP